MGITEEKIVVDTNVLISSLINPDSIAWRIIDLEGPDFLTPEIAVDEIEEYESLIRDKLASQEREEEYNYLLSELFHPIVVVPLSVYGGRLEQAYKIMEPIDEKDTEFLALALQYNCPIWSDDTDFQKQEKVKAFTSEQMVEKFIKSFLHTD
ncbi:MAG: PIN domain-containing protein [Thermoproteota archaeon]